MAITFVGSKEFSATGAASGTFNVSLTDLLTTGGGSATLLEGDLVVIAYSTGSVSDIALNPPSGYTEDAETYSNDTTDTNLAAWRKFMGASPDTSVDLPNSGNTNNAVAGTIFALRGVDQTNTLDVAVVTATGINTANPDPGSITPSTSGAWIMVMGAGSTGNDALDYSLPGDLSATTNHFQSALGTDSVSITCGCGLKTNWSSGAFDPAAWTGADTAAQNSWAAITLAFRSAAAASATGSAVGAGAASATGRGVAPASGSAGGSGVASGFSPNTIGSGSAAGVGAASGVGRAIASASGSASGAGAAAAVLPVDLFPTTGHVTYTGYTPGVIQSPPVSAELALFVPSGAVGTSHNATSRRFRGFTPGQGFYLSYLYKADRTTGSGILTLKARVNWYGASGPLTATEFTVSIDADVASYTFIENRHVAPAGAIEGETVFELVPASSPMQHDVWIIQPRLGITQLGAEITQVVEGPPNADFTHSSTGVADSGQYPRTLNYKLMVGGVVTTTGVTWTYLVKNGTLNGFTNASGAQSITNGALVVSSMGTNSVTVEVTATYNGVARVATVTLNKVFAAPSGGGAGGSNAVQTSGFGQVTSSSFATISNNLVLATGVGDTQIDITVSLAIYPNVASPSGSNNLEFKVQRDISGTFTDQGSVQNSNPDPEIINDVDIGELVMNEGSVSFTINNTGLTASTSYTYRVQARYSTGSANHQPFSFSGSITLS